MLSALTGSRAIDIGMPQLSMHSIREMMGAADLTLATKLLTAFLKDFRAIDASLHKDYYGLYRLIMMYSYIYR